MQLFAGFYEQIKPDCSLSKVILALFLKTMRKVIQNGCEEIAPQDIFDIFGQALAQSQNVDDQIYLRDLGKMSLLVYRITNNNKFLPILQEILTNE